jgi:signal transduction histidine kinase
MGVNDNKASPEDLESMNLLQEGQAQISDAVELIDDISNLAKFDQGAEYTTPSSEKVDLKQGTLEVFQRSLSSSSNDNGKIKVVLELQGGGPSVVTTDKKALTRVLARALIDNALENTQAKGK